MRTAGRLGGVRTGQGTGATMKAGAMVRADRGQATHLCVSIRLSGRAEGQATHWGGRRARGDVQPVPVAPRVTELLTRLRASTNFRVVRDPSVSGGYRYQDDRFPGWEKAPEL